MATDDVYKMTITAAGQGSLYQNVLNLGVKTALDPTNADFATFANDWITIWLAEQVNSLSWTEWEAVQQWGQNMAIDAPKCRRLNAKQFSGTIAGKTGSGIGEGLPPQDALVTTWITGTAGRRKRGRSYVMGMVESNQNEGQWTSAFLGRINTNLDTFAAKYVTSPGTSSSFFLGVWSERTASGCVPAAPPAKGHVPLDTPHPELAFTDVSGRVLRDIVHSQRRRTRGVGR